MPAKRKGSTLIEPRNGLIRLDLGCGQNRPRKEKFGENWIGIDIDRTVGADYVFDLRATRWPLLDETVDEIYTAHFFEHLTGPQRCAFMNECWRVLKPNAKMTVICPYWTSHRATQDPFHEWPPVSEFSFVYFNRKWREDNRLAHYPITADFDFAYAFILDPEIAGRNQEYQASAARRQLNVVLDIDVTLTRRPAPPA